jgi:hypothetical protein
MSVNHAHKSADSSLTLTTNSLGLQLECCYRQAFVHCVVVNDTKLGGVEQGVLQAAFCAFLLARLHNQDLLL